MAARRVIIYRNELLPPSETFILSQANALRRFQPVFAGLKRINPGLEITPHPAMMLSHSESWSEKAKRRIFLRTGYASRFVRTIATQNPQVIHAHFAIDAGAVVLMAKKLSIPLIATLHGYDVTSTGEATTAWPTTRAYIRRKKELWEYASAFICVSEHVRHQALARGFPEKKLWVHPIGVDLNECGHSEQHRDKRIVLFVGRLVEKKGCIHLIHAMSRVQESIPDARLVIVGDGPLRNELESEAAQCCKEVLFLGQQPHAEVKRWMQRSRVLVAPSVRAKNGDSEGLPTVLCEAQAFGLPPVAFVTSGVTEALPVNRRSGMPPEGDVAGLFQKIIHLMEDDDAWQIASDAGRQYVKARFDVSEQTRILEDKYDDVIARYHA
jgi:glycosyltransferase involved in cell wall biosynthesis